MARLSELLARQGAGERGPAACARRRADARAATPDLIERIERPAPSARRAPAPRFAFPDAHPRRPRVGEGI
jgi:single-stranded-DNA-specific exonuclease